jgi:tetratricopeptide (TPR) repeat protein
MSTTPTFKTNPDRDATDSIRGYVYQMYQSVLVWMELKENELLILEGAEDFDVHCDLSVETTQIKDVAHNITLRSKEVIDSLNNYWEHCEKNPDYHIVFRFLTTAEAGKEQSSKEEKEDQDSLFVSNQKGLEYWKNVELNSADIEPLRKFLLTLSLNSNLNTFIQNATADELHEKLISRIKWDLGNKPKEGIENCIKDKLKVHGFKCGISSPIYSCQALPHLLKEVADLLSTKGIKQLIFGDFLSSFEQATMVLMPRQQMEMMQYNHFQQQAVNSELLRLAQSSPIGMPIPIVNGSIARKNLVLNTIQLLKEQQIIFLYGSSGLGKTNLAALMTDEMGGSWGWAGFRNRPPEQIKDILLQASFQINSKQLPPFLVLDDINLKDITLFEYEFISLIFSIVNANGLIIVTGTIQPPLHLFPKIWKDETCSVNVPYFDEIEITEMVKAHGFYEEKYMPTWARVIWLATSGHPQLVHARVRNLSRQNWPKKQLLEFTQTEDIGEIRSQTTSRLVRELPNENARILVYRLSLINGSFTRETAMAVAEPPPPIRLVGEAFDALIGPWIEKQGKNRFRISPLLSGAAKNNLLESEINPIHRAIVISILSRNDNNQFDFASAFFHAFTIKHTEALLGMAVSIVKIDRENIHYLYDAMSWFTFVCLKDEQKIVTDKPDVELMLRLAQYKLISYSPESDNIFIVIKHIEETLNEIEPLEIKQKLEVITYSNILSILEVSIPFSIIIRMLSRVIDLEQESLILQELYTSFKKNKNALPVIGENKPSQILFSFQAHRLAGLDDLLDLVNSLNTLSLNKRNLLLAVCNSEVEFTKLLINNAWWQEVKNGNLDINKALIVLNYTLTKSREWYAPELTKHCLIALCVIQNEYANLTDKALEILDEADKEFPNDANLLYQRSFVLFRAKQYYEALEISKKVLQFPKFSKIDFVYCCRYAGISSAALENWSETEYFFLLGAEKSKELDVLNNMGVGLLADAAFAQWKQEKYADSLLTFTKVLNALGNIPVSNELYVRHLHATVRHIICWIHFDSRDNHKTDLVTPFAGMCSNQKPSEGIKDHRIVDICGIWDLLAATEYILGLDIGIKKQAKIVTNGRKLIASDSYLRSIAFENMFKIKNFDNFVTSFIKVQEGINYYKNYDRKEKSDWEIGNIAKLPENYWNTYDNWGFFYQYLLIACVISTADNQNMPLPVERWRTDLLNSGALFDNVDSFLNVLNGATPDDSLYQHAAAFVFKLRKGVVSPEELWRASFRLLNAFMNDKRLVESALEKMLISRWVFAAKEQRLFFSTPRIICSEIEQLCADSSHQGLAKIAAVLDITAPYLDISMAENAKKMIKQLKASK